MDENTAQECVDAYRSFISNNTQKISLDNFEETMLMDEEDWEQTKDIFFMLRIPFEVDSTEESREKFSKALTKRHRKRGRYGPQGGLSVN